MMKDKWMAVGPTTRASGDVLDEVTGNTFPVNYAGRSSFETKWVPFHVVWHVLGVKDGVCRWRLREAVCK